MGLAPISNVVPENKLKVPYNQRVLMIGWNMINNSDHRFEPDAKQSAEWNRGAYLTEALGHCQQCHTPRNFMQGLKSSKAYDGAVQQGWLAYNISSDKTAGIGGWSDADLASYLSTGHADGHGSASGPMAEAIENSLRYLTPDDIKAMVTYLKTVPAQSGNPAPPPVTAKPDLALGAKIYEEACQSCHRANGTGSVTPYAALLGSPSVADPAGTNLVSVLLYGSRIDTATGTQAMPGFAHGYTDVELAAVANYTIAQLGKSNGAVTRETVAKARSTGID
jgi:mono/diheme cytochrome c family protein